MLRITADTDQHGRATYLLEGRLAGAYVAELGSVVGPAVSRPSRVALDLSGLTFVDAQGARLLRELRASNVEIRGCSSFVAHLLGVA